MGGWEGFEELCVAFVATTRAQDRLVYLPHLETLTRDGVLSFFDAPVTDAEKIASQGTDTDASQAETERAPSPPPTASSDVHDALLLLSLTALPESVAELNKIVRREVFVAHPDKNFNDPLAKERTQRVLAAREVLLKAIAARDK